MLVPCEPVAAIHLDIIVISEHEVISIYITGAPHYDLRVQVLCELTVSIHYELSLLTLQMRSNKLIAQRPLIMNSNF